MKLEEVAWRLLSGIGVHILVERLNEPPDLSLGDLALR